MLLLEARDGVDERHGYNLVLRMGAGKASFVGGAAARGTGVDVQKQILSIQSASAQIFRADTGIS